ncbi:MAG: DUF1638 domain-containing protein [Spirochaetaceae bacterium]|nr:MAG: DUF1638 domain-containing protein [Spirochaetaceae bacterium]
MYFKLIACDVLTREVCHCIARSPHTVDVEFTEKGQHEDSERLRLLLQEKIDRSAETRVPFDAILLAYGLCGNSTAQLEARSIQLVLPRAHDCCTIFLGSRRRFKELFADNPSRPFSSAGYMERGDSYLHDGDTGRVLGLDRSYEDFVAQYGEENAKYIMETLSLSRDGNTDDKVIYIDVPETSREEYASLCRETAEKEGRRFIRVEGNIRLIRQLVEGTWNEEEFLIVKPGRKIRAVYDWEEIIRVGD